MNKHPEDVTTLALQAITAIRAAFMEGLRHGQPLPESGPSKAELLALRYSEAGQQARRLSRAVLDLAMAEERQRVKEEAA